MNKEFSFGENTGFNLAHRFDASQSELLGAAKLQAKKCSSMEIMRAVGYCNLNNAIDKLENRFEERGLYITNDKNIALLHIKSTGTGAILDSVYSCQSRLINTVSPSEYPKVANKIANYMIEALQKVF